LNGGISISLLISSSSILPLESVNGIVSVLVSKTDSITILNAASKVIISILILATNIPPLPGFFLN
jgi:hypothetical protein